MSNCRRCTNDTVFFVVVELWLGQINVDIIQMVISRGGVFRSFFFLACVRLLRADSDCVVHK